MKKSPPVIAHQLVRQPRAEQRKLSSYESRDIRRDDIVLDPSGISPSVTLCALPPRAMSSLACIPRDIEPIVREAGPSNWCYWRLR